MEDRVRADAASELLTSRTPVLIEPRLALSTQFRFWAAGFVIFAVACGVCALVSRAAPKKAEAPAAEA